MKARPRATSSETSVSSVPCDAHSFVWELSSLRLQGAPSQGPFVALFSLSHFFLLPHCTPWFPESGRLYLRPSGAIESTGHPRPPTLLGCWCPAWTGLFSTGVRGRSSSRQVHPLPPKRGSWGLEEMPLPGRGQKARCLGPHYCRSSLHSGTFPTPQLGDPVCAMRPMGSPHHP